ncbi:MAG: 3-deoxy-manno-octulosonate cytidylyltransferase [Candidatus Aminicenantes bacterium RBG_13_59_9]|nr:MAG: 3-deoxy-manno-octulosonate cytidylyltransferase [Candidatus Aminicenantes bacterium RBG_13_59_9]
MKKAVGVIPARYASTRFPGKPLALILGRPMLQWVYEAAAKAGSLERVIIATDDARIFEQAGLFGAEAVMTSPDHASGTDRVAETAAGLDVPIVVNIQGDEPLLRPEMIDGLVSALQDDSVTMASLMTRAGREDVLDRNTVKVVVDVRGFALYFSRFPIPFGATGDFFKHIGMYGYRRDFLLGLSRMPATGLEKVEKLEQLRVLENGFKIKMVECDGPSLSVDSPEDIIKVENLLKSRK